jgi:prophage regulatory protein
MDKILRLNEVKTVTGLSRSSLYLMIKRGEFPKNIPLNNFRAVGWLESEIQGWIESRILSRKCEAGGNHV